MNARNVMARMKTVLKNVTLHIVRGEELDSDRFMLVATELDVTVVLLVREYGEYVRVIVEACTMVEDNRVSSVYRKLHAMDKVISRARAGIFAETNCDLVEVMREVESN